MATVAYWMVVAGVIGGLAAGLLGWLDWVAIPPGTRAKRIGLLHGIGNIVVLLLFVGSWSFRPTGARHNCACAFVCGRRAGALDGWRGGKLVQRLGRRYTFRINELREGRWLYMTILSGG
jgi:uncharacterized membrane protein